MPAKYKLTYFNARARAETTRCIFAAAGVEYEDNRIAREDWMELKPSTPFGQLPLLEFDGKMVGQSLAITRYIAKETGFAGKDAVEEVMVDSLGDTIQDLFSKLVTVKFAPEAEKEEKMSVFVEGPLTQTLKALEKFLTSNKGGDGFFVGDSLTWADIHLMTLSDHLLLLDPKVYDKYPKLEAHNTRVRANKGIATWLEKRPETNM